MFIFSTLTRSSPPKRFSAKWLRKAEALARIRREKIAKFGRRCQVKSPVCDKWESGLHHLLKRSQGGADSAENTLLCCAACNRWVENHPAEAVKLGISKRRSS